MSYEDKAFEIVKQSISSAIFIDDNLKDFYSFSDIDTTIIEEVLSKELHQSFKAEGISLAVHKFVKTDVEDINLNRYFFKNRDLVLLDWELDDTSGEEYSLKLLSEVINYSHINFCCIYTKTPRFDSIHSQIESYFSGLNDDEFAKIKDIYSHLEESDITKIKTLLDSKSEDVQDSLNEIGIDLSLYPHDTTSPIESLKNIYFAFLKNVKSKKKEKRSDLISTGIDSFVINNTLVFLLKKDGTNDPKPSVLLRRISNELIKNQNSFIQLLGLEMQTVFNTNESFIDENILNSSTEALFKHRNYLYDKEKEDKTFSIIIKKLLIEHATLKLRTSKLELLNSDFLIEHSKTITDKPNNEELHNLNTFYNSVTVKSLNDIDIPNLNFGDIFKDNFENYYLCITALCDCYYPNKIDHNFYFVTGKEFSDIELALKLGDTAFLSFLPNGKSVYWGNLEIPKKNCIKKGTMDDSDYKLAVLQSDLKSYQDFLYKPYYVKPKIFNVQGVKMIDNKLKIWDITYKSLKTGEDHNLNYIDIDYVATLRTDYVQRIANHAFGHPARVGVDFVKKA